MTYFFSGQVNRIIFENGSNFFKILLLDIDETDSEFEDYEIIVTGTIADIIEGESYTFWGELITHPKYGEQLSVERYEHAKPSSSGLVSYFSSQQFKGIGKKTAEKIIQAYGDNTIDNILENPEKLSDIKGLSRENREAFVNQLQLNYGTEKILAKLAAYGLSNRIAITIFNAYKEETLDIISENPYQLVEDIQGIGFKVADQFAEQLGITASSPQRFRAALVHVLFEEAIEKGDTYTEARDLLEKSLTLLEEARQIELSPEAVAAELSHLIEEDKVQHEGTKIFHNSLYYAEEGISKHLNRLLTTPLDKAFDREAIRRELEKVEESLSIRYDDTQRYAIIQALESKVFILTGGPGTGKTTIINGLIATYKNLYKLSDSDQNLPILLAAPTGRAARRMNELTGLPSATIHRHLGLTNEIDYHVMDDYLDCNLIIIDEFSMVDTWLAHQLLSAIASDTQVIIVGDSDQLPSVGPGQVLADLLAVPEIPQIALNKIFRQSDESTIVTLASQIRQGILPSDFTSKKPDRSYLEVSPQHITDLIPKIVTAALNKGIEKQEIQILAPMYRGLAGITQLNTIMQDLLNPLDNEISFAFNDLTFRKGDKILHLINDAQANVFNGDIGYITDLIPAKYTESKQDEIYLSFDTTQISYPRNEWHKITLAYAMSIHKSQGSEFQVVILPITRQSQRMLRRNLIYTAITRSKSKLILLGELEAFSYAIQNEGSKRQTYLTQRFAHPSDQSLIDDEDSQSETLISTADTPSSDEPKVYRLTPSNLTQIDPLIGLTQTDFDTFFKNS